MHNIFNCTDIFLEIIKYLSCSDSINLCLVNNSLYRYKDLILKYKNVVINSIYVHKYNNAHKSSNVHKYNNAHKSINSLFINGIKYITDINIVVEFRNIKYVHFDKSFNHNINSLPPTIEHIEFHKKSIFNKKIKCKLPNLISIIFGKNFNKIIDYLPDSVEIVKFTDASKFNQDIKKLPKNIKEIYFGKAFNKSLNNSLLNAFFLKKVVFTARSVFNQQIINYPHSLTDLHFGDNYNRPINVTNCKLYTLKFNKLSKFNAELIFNHINIIYLGNTITHQINFCNYVECIFFNKGSAYKHDIITYKTCKTIITGRMFKNLIILI